MKLLRKDMLDYKNKYDIVTTELLKKNFQKSIICKVAPPSLPQSIVLEHRN